MVGECVRLCSTANPVHGCSRRKSLGHFTAWHSTEIRCRVPSILGGVLKNSKDGVMDRPGDRCTCEDCSVPAIVSCSRRMKVVLVDGIRAGAPLPSGGNRVR